MALDSADNLYIADSENHRIRMVDASDIITTVAGNGSSGFSGDGGPATSAQLRNPFGVALDSADNLYIVDSENHRIRMVDASDIITTVAGSGVPAFSGDGGLATSAQLRNPFGVALDSADNLYIADTSNHRIRMVAAGIISTVAGNGSLPGGSQPNPPGSSGDGGPATSASLSNPRGVALDSADNLYIADSEHFRIRMVVAGTISAVAGNGFFGSGGDEGPAIGTQLASPVGVALDSADKLYIVDDRIRLVVAGIISTVAGNGTSGDDFPQGDGGPAIDSQLGPSGVALDSAGNLYIAELGSHRIRMVDASGIISTVAGNGGLAIDAQLRNPSAWLLTEPAISTLPIPATNGFAWWMPAASSPPLPETGAVALAATGARDQRPVSKSRRPGA